jgi:hypothetical protein
MNDHLISPETFKLAKEVGFDIHICRCGGFPECICTDPLPTQSELQTWLRVKRGLILWVEYTGIADIKWCYHIYGRLGVHTGNSYEECLEAGLVDALKLI